MVTENGSVVWREIETMPAVFFSFFADLWQSWKRFFGGQLNKKVENLCIRLQYALVRMPLHFPHSEWKEIEHQFRVLEIDSNSENVNCCGLN